MMISSRGRYALRVMLDMAEQRGGGNIRLKEIAARGGISCACGSKRWKMQVNYSSIDLSCADCGATMRIPAATASDIDDICCKNTIVIHSGH